MAEEVVVDQRHLLPVPDSLSWAEAAAIPEVFSTAWLNIFVLGDARPGEKVLIHAGASGVGSTAVQLAKHWGARVIATDATPYFRTLTVDRGGGDGVRGNLAVIAPGGVVGRVIGQPGARAAKVREWPMCPGGQKDACTVPALGKYVFSNLFSEKVKRP